MAGIRVIVLTYVLAIGLLVLSETRMVYPGARTVVSSNWLPAADERVPWDTVRVLAADGVPVMLLESRLDDEGTGPWAIFFHGNGGVLGRGSSVERYALLREAGFNVLAVEFRGYGVSREVGPPFEVGLYADAMGGRNYLVDSLGVEPARVIAYGWSLGAGVATYLATEGHVGALVTEGAFTSAPDVGADLYPWLPVRLMMRNRFDNLARAEVLAVPWVVFHGRADTVVPFSHGERLRAASERARFFPLDAGHNDGVIADRDVALAALHALAEEVAASQPAGG